MVWGFFVCAFFFFPLLLTISVPACSQPKEAAEIAADGPATRMLFTAAEKSQLPPVKDGEFTSLLDVGRAGADTELEEEEGTGFLYNRQPGVILLGRLLLVGTWTKPSWGRR